MLFTFFLKFLILITKTISFDRSLRDIDKQISITELESLLTGTNCLESLKTHMNN